jgi:hypothetical protein
MLKKLALFPPKLDALYKQIILKISKSDNTKTCHCVLATTAVLYQPVTISKLITLIKQLRKLINDLESVQKIISLYESFLTL